MARFASSLVKRMTIDQVAALAAKVARAQRVYVRNLSITPDTHCPIARDALALAEKAYNEAIGGLSFEELRELEPPAYY